MSRIFKILLGLHSIYWKILNKLWFFIPQRSHDEIKIDKFSIGVVTYVDRYDNFFKPLIKNLTKIFPDTEIVVTINGYHDQEIQKEYLVNINFFLSKYSNIKIISFTEPQSLSKLWNLLIINSAFKRIFIFNDDIKISPFFRISLINSKIIESEVALINSSWSHFMISKSTIKKVGWFDERFPAVGNEDQDYECRLAHEGITPQIFKVNGIKNIIFLTKNFSYGKEIEVNEKKYIMQNQIFFDSKWQLSDLELPGFKYVRILNKFVIQKPLMDTPDFYNAINFDE